MAFLIALLSLLTFAGLFIFVLNQEREDPSKIIKLLICGCLIMFCLSKAHHSAEIADRNRETKKYIEDVKKEIRNHLKGVR